MSSPPQPSKMVHYLGAILAFTVCYLVASTVYRLYFHPLRKYPGPKLWAISQIPFSRAWMSGTGHKKILYLHQRYGDIVRVAPNELSFGNPGSWNDIMGHRKREQDENGKDPDFWRGNDQLTLVGSNRERHSRLRKIMSHGFSAQAMIGQQPIIQGYVALLIDRLKTASANRRSVEMTSWYNWATFDMAGDLIFGEPFGCLEKAEYHPWVKLIYMHITGIAFSTAVIRYPFSDALIKLLTPKSVAEDMHMHAEFIKAQVGKRMSHPSPRPDFMESIIRAHENGQVSHPEVIANAHNLIVGGSETTGTALAGVTYLLAKNPIILDKLYQELTSKFKAEDEIDLISVQKLEYMFAVLHEAMRIYPPVPSAIPRRTPPQGSTIGTEFVPPNTILGIWQWPMFHNPKYFKDPEMFVPERWLDDACYAGDIKIAMQPFSVGPRNCIGKNLAYAEMGLILARLVWNFNIELEHRSSNWLDDNKMFFLWKKPELHVFLTERPVST